MALLTFSLVALFLCYLVRASGGIPESLSATYYEPDVKGWVLQLMLVGTGFLLMPAWIEESPQDLQFLAFLSCAGLVFVGAAPMFRLPLQGAVHYASAAVCCTSSVVWVVLMGYYPIVVSSAFLAFMAYLRWGQWMWWLEMAVIGMVFASIT